MKLTSLWMRVFIFNIGSNYCNRDRTLTRFTGVLAGSGFLKRKKKEEYYNYRRISPSVICIRNYRCRAAGESKAARRDGEEGRGGDCDAFREEGAEILFAALA